MPFTDARDRSAYHRKRRLACVAWLSSVKSARGCAHCLEKDPAVLDFHHRDRAQKKFVLMGSHCYSRSRVEILAEIAKCEVLCANDHRREEARLRKLVDKGL